jgi:7-cyano-7-deazaguanine synthase
MRNSSQTDDDIAVPHGHYTDESMKVTVVPNRNMVLLSVAIAEAISTGCENVAIAAHIGDHTIYPDCRAMFLLAMRDAARECHFEPIEILAPFIACTKAEIVHDGAELKVPFELTWSCYEGKAFHCGECGTCVERKEAFQIAGVTDPTVYEK